MTSPQLNFDVLCEPQEGRIDFPDVWQQGRGLYGGLACATMLRALEQHVPGRAVRSFSAELVGPIQPGPAHLTVSLLREGSAVTTSSVRLEQNGALLAHAVGVLGLSRVQDRNLVPLTPPALRAWKDLEMLPVEPPLGPVFAQHFEYRLVGELPFSSGAHAVTEGFVRLKRPGTRRDVAWLAGIADAHWPTLFQLESMPRPMATIAFTLQPFTIPADLDHEAPVFHRARLQAAEDGYCVEQRELWGQTTSGAVRLLGLNQQTFVIIK